MRLIIEEYNEKNNIKFWGILLIGGFLTSLNASTPNEWISEGSVFGNSYTIVDKSGLTLEIFCKTPFYDNDEHSILLFRKYTEILERSKEDKDNLIQHIHLNLMGKLIRFHHYIHELKRKRMNGASFVTSFQKLEKLKF